MLYLNQLQCGEMAYPTNLKEPESEWATAGTVRRAGCGLCSVCMVVDRLTDRTLTLEQARDLSVESGANWNVGTDMTVLGPAVAERFGLELCMTDDIALLRRGLQAGGAAILNVGGDQDGVPGIFSNAGHYLVAISYRAGRFCLLDPSLTEEKYAKPPRRTLVRRDGIFLYAAAETLRRDTRTRSPACYLFNRKVPGTQRRGGRRHPYGGRKR